MSDNNVERDPSTHPDTPQPVVQSPTIAHTENPFNPNAGSDGAYRVVADMMVDDEAWEDVGHEDRVKGKERGGGQGGAPGPSSARQATGDEALAREADVNVKLRAALMSYQPGSAIPIPGELRAPEVQRLMQEMHGLGLEPRMPP